MRNLLIYILLIILKTGYGQDLQNANWIFGHGAWVTFNTTPPSGLPALPSSLGFYTEEGSASISDNSGNLLFFTDGVSIYKPLASGGYETIATGLYGDTSSAQNAIIVHKPGAPNRYYIFTIKGETSKPINTGLYYSEIDLSESNPVISMNIPLKDSNGVEINGTWGNISEALTCTKHSDNYQYWVEAFVGKDNGSGYLLSFLVGDLGIENQSPKVSQIINFDNFAYCLKVMNNKIAVGTGSNGAFLGSFNNSTGQAIFNTLSLGNGFIPQNGCYSLEFSETGNSLYFLNDSTLNFFSINVNNPNNIIIINTQPSSFFSKRFQRAIDGKIYYVSGNSNQHLCVINNPDNLTNPNIGSDFVPFASYSELGLPQLVEIQPLSGPCTNTIKDRTNIYAPNTVTMQASNLLILENTIDSGSTGIYHAGNTVLLNHGFHSMNGSKLRAYIEGCTDNFQGRISNSNPSNESNDIIDSLTIYPNPVTNGVLNINTTANDAKNVVVYDVLGKQVVNTTISGSTVNVANLKNGVYIVKITENGKTATRKLVIR